MVWMRVQTAEPPRPLRLTGLWPADVPRDNANGKIGQDLMEIGGPPNTDRRLLFSDFAPVAPAQLSLSDAEALVFQECYGRDSSPSSAPGRGSGQSPYSSNPLL